MPGPGRRVAILGSTGSIGRSALDLIERLNETHRSGDPFRVVALAANRSTDTLADQIRRFRPLLACIGSEELVPEVRRRTGDLPTRVVGGPEGLREIATMPGADTVLAGIVGGAGLEATYEAAKAGKRVALANKEALVMAGAQIMQAARESGASILPVDSEHNALHQCLRGERIGEVKRLVLTASGGPFFSRPDLDLSRVTPAQALAHPTWNMGRKISIDSATLMNKGLEVIEARWLFGVPGNKISVVVHPQSRVHSLVEFIDGSFLCQLGATDMRHPIQYALTYPDRCLAPLDPVDLCAMESLSFLEPDWDRFPCLGFGWRALEAGGTMPAVLNAANEVAVQAFLDGRARFTDIPEIICKVMDMHRPVAASSLGEILEADAWAREEARMTATGTLNRSGGAA